MKNMKMWKSFLSLSILFIAAGCNLIPAKNNETVLKHVKVGVVLPLTGDLADLGEEIQRGIELKATEAKAQGYDIELIFEDDKSLSSPAAASAANKLISVDHVNIGLTMIVEEARPIIPIFTAAKIPLLILWDSNEFIKQSGDYVFSNGFSTEQAGQDMAVYAYEKLGTKKIAIIAHNDAWADIISKVFGDTFAGLGGKIVYDEKIAPNATDYRTIITKIKATHPDAVYAPLIPPNLARFLIQAKQLGLTVPIMTGDTLPYVMQDAGATAEGVYFTNVYQYAVGTDELAKNYKQTYKSDPIDLTLVSFGYDGLNQVIEGINRTQKPNSQSLESALTEIYGPDRSSKRAEKIYQVENGRFLEIK